MLRVEVCLGGAVWAIYLVNLPQKRWVYRLVEFNRCVNKKK